MKEGIPCRHKCDEIQQQHCINPRNICVHIMKGIVCKTSNLLAFPLDECFSLFSVHFHPRFLLNLESAQTSYQETIPFSHPDFMVHLSCLGALV